jgi:hypothetical protein
MIELKGSGVYLVHPTSLASVADRPAKGALSFSGVPVYDLHEVSSDPGHPAHERVKAAFAEAFR